MNESPGDRTRASWLCLAGALLFTLRFDAALLSIGNAEARSIYPASAALVSSVLETTLVAALVFLLLLACSRRRGLIVPAIVTLFAACDVPAYFVRKYETSVRVAVTSALDGTDRESVFVLGWGWLPSLAIAIAAGAIVGVSIRMFGTGAKTSRRPSTVVAVLLIFTALGIDAAYFDGRARSKVWLDYLPLALVSQTWHYASATRAYANKLDISQKDYALADSSRDLVFVFVIGESARAANFSLNGYPRRTNPELESLPNVVSFTQASSAATSTRQSVPVMLTRMTTAEARPQMARTWTDRDVYVRETSFISVFNKLGFATSFLANWTPYGMWSTSETIFAGEAAFTYFPHSKDLSKAERASRREVLRVRDGERFDQEYDENLLFVLDHRLRTTGATRSLVVMHPYGSHFPYVSYPKEFERFTPPCDFWKVGFELGGCGPALANSYDNTILYADWMLGQIIRRLANRNAVLLYVGDHAESLGENGQYLHSHDSPWEKHVPLVFWASERYLADPLKRAKFEALRANKDRPVTHDFVFHTTLDLAGIASDEVLRPELSLCRPPSP